MTAFARPTTLRHDDGGTASASATTARASWVGNAAREQY